MTPLVQETRQISSRVRDDTLPFEIRPSPMQGLGAFATRPIGAGVRLIEYAGERLTPAEADARYPDVKGERHHTFLFAIDDDVVIDAAFDGNEARFINHSCDPNCDAIIEDGRIWIETIRDVRAGGAGVRLRVRPRGAPHAGRQETIPVLLRRGQLPRYHPREEAPLGDSQPPLLGDLVLLGALELLGEAPEPRRQEKELVDLVRGD